MEVTVSVVDSAWQSGNIKLLLQPEYSTGHTSCRWTSYFHTLQSYIVKLHQGNHATWTWDIIVLQGRYLQHPVLQKDQVETRCAVLS